MDRSIEILIVEDNPNDLELMMHALQRGGITNRLEHVGDGEDALDFLFCRGRFSGREPTHPPRLVLLDLKLPKVDGIEVVRQVKSDPATRAIPLVILTASREERDLVESYQLGVNSYIQKPLDFQQFQKTVRETGLFWLLVNAPPPPAAFNRRAGDPRA